MPTILLFVTSFIITDIYCSLHIKACNNPVSDQDKEMDSTIRCEISKEIGLANYSLNQIQSGKNSQYSV